jgi:MinD superfamily P-loop ATPase
MKQQKPIEIVIISGKGGTGKTTIAASLADIIPDKIVIDADVDAANLYLLMSPENIRGTDFKGKSLAVINREICVSCNRCRELCRFHAIAVKDGYYQVDDLSCEGCGLCEIACPVKAVEMHEQVVGQWFTADTAFGNFIYARLKPGAENSGNLVVKVKQEGKQRAEEKGKGFILVDGPPGIGCPVIAAVSGAHLAIIVTEPTYSGISDLERVFVLVNHFGITCGIVINRWDINPENTRKIEDFAHEKGVPVYARIPHSSCIIDAISRGKLPARACKVLAREVEQIYKYIQKWTASTPYRNR